MKTIALEKDGIIRYSMPAWVVVSYLMNGWNIVKGSYIDWDNYHE